MISIIIRAKNEEQYIAEVIRAVLAQDDHEEFEVLIIDSGSTDRTKELVRQFPVRLHEIPSNRFSFGSALNLGVELAQGRIIVNLSAHCTPTSHDWLRQLVEPLRRDPTLVATYGRQEPRKRMNPFEEPGLQAAFPADRIRRPGALFSNANCAIWRKVLLSHPFDEIIAFSEDLVWRVQFQLDEVRYVPEASVYHSHPINFRYWAQRFENSGVSTIEMQRRYGIINPYVSKSEGFAQAVRAFVTGCIDSCFFFIFQGYLSFIPLVPFFEGLRVWSLTRGLRRGKLIAAR
jgi:glycosyltransferase involved in cell wall biosynthesis